MMSLRVGLSGFLLSMAFFAADASACEPAPLPPPLEGESRIDYGKRVETMRIKEAADWLVQRQADALTQADTIFVGRFVYWFPPYKPKPLKPGQRPAPPPPPVMPDITNPGPSYFKPIDWFRGVKSTRLVRTRNSWTSCGAEGFGDTRSATEGDLYLFFARKGSLIEKNLIDAIAIDSINDPALIEFVAKYRKPVAKTALSPR